MLRPSGRILKLFAALLVATPLLWLSTDWVGGALFRRGIDAQRHWKLETAINYLTWARRLQHSPHLASFQLGQTQQLRGDFLASQNELTRLLRENLADKELLSRVHNAIGINQYSFAEPDAAIASHQIALERAREVGNYRLEAEAMIGLGRAFYHSKGKIDEAVAKLESAKSIAQKFSDRKIEAAAVRNLGVINWWFRGELDRPLNEFYLPALELYRAENDQRGEATMLSLVALVFKNKGDIYRFTQYQTESIAIQERIGDQAGMSDSYMHMGMLYGEMGNYRKAREYYSRSLTLTRQIGYKLAQLDLESLMAGVHLHLDEYDEAIKFYDPLGTHHRTDAALTSPTEVAYCYQLKGDYARALSLYERALQAHRKNPHPDVRFEVNVLLSSAECSMSLGDWTRAADLIEQADKIVAGLDKHSSGDLPPATARARLAQHQGRDREALNYLQAALETEAQIFASSQTNLLIPPHRRIYENLFSLLTDYSSSKTSPEIAAFATSLTYGFLENMRYRSLRNFVIRSREKQATRVIQSEQERHLLERIESLKSSRNSASRGDLRKAYSEYEDLTLKLQLAQSQYLPIAAAKPIALGQLQHTLSPDTALVEFVLSGENVFAVSISKDQARVIDLPVKKNALIAKTKLLRSLIFGKDASEIEWLPVAESLRTLLITPLEDSGVLTGVERIGLIPFGVLHDLPFAALVRRENDNLRFLIEDYKLFQTPSATFYAHRTRSGSNPSSTMVALGRNGSTSESLPALEYAAAEAQAVAETMNGTVLVNQEATESALKQLAPTSDYLHLSTHAVAESDMPLFSRLLMEKSGTDDGNLTVREVFELGLHTKLVTLSACDTGQSYSASGTDFIEQDRLGLIEAFLHAGSDTVLATLLPISDRQTTEFMKYFYYQLSQKPQIAEALTATQRAVLRGEITLSIGQQNPKHPRFWAPFFLTGRPD